jgi:ribose 5-phosphate isomerase B
MKIAIGNDHAAVEMKEHIKKHLEAKGYTVVDYGTNTSESTAYAIYGKKVADAVASGECDYGVLICGTGIGISLAANKVKGIRAAVCSEPYSARLTRLHNNANIIAFGARVVGIGMAEMIVDEFFSTAFEGGRHQTRIDMITDIEEGRM